MKKAIKKVPLKLTNKFMLEIKDADYKKMMSFRSHPKLQEYIKGAAWSKRMKISEWIDMLIVAHYIAETKGVDFFDHLEFLNADR